MKQLRLPNNFSLASVSTTLAVFVSRLEMLPANISPLGSFGFFGNPWLYGLSILAFDLGVKGIYPGVLFTYLGFAAYPLLGWLTRKNIKLQVIALPIASFLFFLLSNLGVWWYWYDHTWAKLVVCFTLALPFYTRTILSDLVFGYGYVAFKEWRSVKTKAENSQVALMPQI